MKRKNWRGWPRQIVALAAFGTGVHPDSTRVREGRAKFLSRTQYVGSSRRIGRVGMRDDVIFALRKSISSSVCLRAIELGGIFANAVSAPGTLRQPPMHWNVGSNARTAIARIPAPHYSLIKAAQKLP